MSTYKHRDRWRYRFTFRGKRYSGSAPRGQNTRAGAEKAENARLRQLEGGAFADRVPTVAEFAVKFLEHQTARTTASTARHQRNNLNKHVVPHFGHIKLDTFGTVHIDQLITMWSAAKAEPRSINTRLFTLKRLLSLAVEWGIIARAPKFERIKVPKDTPRFLTDDEADRLLSAMPMKWATMALVALRTGLRVGELRALRWCDIDLARRAIQVRRTAAGRKGMEITAPKSKTERTVPLTPEATGVIRAMRAHDVPSEADLVWPGFAGNSNRRIDRNRVRSESACVKAMRTAVRKAGLDLGEQISWHTLRHTFASWLVLRGVHAREIQQLLGHGNIQITQRYMHLAPGNTLHASVALLDTPMMANEPGWPNQGSGDHLTLPSGSDAESLREREQERLRAPSPHSERNRTEFVEYIDGTEHW